MIKILHTEGTTPIDDLSGLKIPWIKNLSDLNRAETENISQAIEKYLIKSVSLPLKWFNVINLKKIHQDMFHEVWNWAGKFRSTQTIPGIKPYQIQSALKDLCDDVFYWNKEGCEMTFIEQSARIHHRLVFIHPFPNGNGRFARIIADRYLKAWKCSFPMWPKDLQNITKIRKQYILSLQAADLGDYSLLIQFMKNCGGQDPTLNTLLKDKFYKKNINKKTLIKLIQVYKSNTTI